MMKSVANFEFSGGLHELLGFATRVQSIGDFVFFRLILNFLRERISAFGLQLMENMMAWVLGISLTLMTLWVLIQGYRIVTGRSRDSMMILVTNMARAALIVSVASSMGMFGTNLHTFFTKTVRDEITQVVTNTNKSPEEQIDDNLAYLQVALASIDAIDVMSDPEMIDEKARAMWYVGLGTAGPAITAGSMLLLYEIAIALFIGLGPLFILCLLFEQTKSLFQRWLFYGIGTLFSMAVLAAMTSIALDMVYRVAKAFWLESAGAKLILGPAFENGLSSQAMQQGGMGLILTTLILTAPPMAAMFFQGTLGSFMAYSQIGGGAAATPSADGRPPGSHGQERPASSNVASTGSDPGRMSGFGGGSAVAHQSDTGKYGAAR
ncbi:type VI secretion protein [Stenotrophomonas maltophilia]|nr:type IV secretion system protein [Stenotrophomonas maltophilia]PSD18398.1 type VI secretion protein [Stenotrophomonas maltophilia]PSD32078.1 type VI secretion protein [Stenotrophomonas maltophilia]PZT25083.1 type VI secretion protein [Stenotrophomonas maltophilia]